MLLVGVTLALGSLVATSALAQSDLANSSASLGAASEEASARVQIGLVYLAVASSGSCPAYGGYHEGTSLSVAVYNYGGGTFAPAELVLNQTVYPGSYSPLGPGSMGTYTLTLAACSHSAGQTVMLADAAGDEAQFVS
jgi:hypothetical protein